jgi:hypothetical protein
MNIQKINNFISEHRNLDKKFEQDYFRLGICELLLGNYAVAKSLFSDSTTLMFGERPFWRMSSQPDWLVNITILSGNKDLHPSILEELRLY